MTLLARPNGSWIDRVLAATMAFLLIADPVWATQLTWKGPLSGNAGTASNWNPAQVPTAADSTTFNVGGTYTVTFSGTVPATTAHFYRSGTVTVVAATGHTMSGVLRVGSVANDNGTLTLSNALLTVGSLVTIGNPTGATGTVNVNATTADLLQSGTTADVIVGSSGTGTLNVTNGGLVDAADDVLVGNGSGSQGTLLVSGVSASPSVRATVTSSGTDGDVLIGNAGTANATVDFGGQLVSSDDVRIGTGGAGHGTLTVQNAIGAFVSLLTIGDDLDIANNDVSGITAGTGSLLVQSFGQANVTDRTRVGDPDGGSGTLSIRPSSFFHTRSLIVDNTHGTLDMQGGTLTVEGGLFDPAGTTIDIDDAAFESVQLYNGATATFDGGSPVGYSMIVGDTHSGGLRVDSGSHVTNLNGVIAVALAPGSNGVVDVYDSSLVDSVGMMVVGQGGFGELNIGGGSKVKLTEMKAAYSPGSNGFVDVSGAGARLTLTDLDIGGHETVAGGTASVGVGSGGVIDIVGGGSVAIRLEHSQATLNVQAGGTVNAGTDINNLGRIFLAGGVINANALSMFSGGLFDGYGTVAGNISMAAGTSLHVPTTGALTVGSNASNKGFVSSGTTIADTTVLNILDLDQCALGNLILNSSSVHLPAAGGGLIASGMALGGSGDLFGNLTNSGEVSIGTSAVPRGAVRVRGNYAQTAGGKLTMQIGDAPTIQLDRLMVDTTATLSGTLDIQILPGFTPDPGEDFTLITCGSRSGTFSTVTYQGQPPGGQFTIIYNPKSVVLHVNQITTDVPPPGGLPRELAFSGRSGASADAGFELALPEASRVTLRLYSVTGRFLGTLFEGEHDAGVFAIRLRDLETKLPGGVYFGRVSVRKGASEQIRTAKVTLVR